MGPSTIQARALKFLMVIVAAYVILVLPGFVWRSYFDSPAGYLVLVPLLSIYLLHRLGVPGVLEHDGLCGWGWCSPTLFGWVFLMVFWLFVAWCIAWAAAVLVNRLAARPADGKGRSSRD